MNAINDLYWFHDVNSMFCVVTDPIDVYLLVDDIQPRGYIHWSMNNIFQKFQPNVQYEWEKTTGLCMLIVWMQLNCLSVWSRDLFSSHVKNYKILIIEQMHCTTTMFLCPNRIHICARRLGLHAISLYKTSMTCIFQIYTGRSHLGGSFLDAIVTLLSFQYKMLKTIWIVFFSCVCIWVQIEVFEFSTQTWPFVR